MLPARFALAALALVSLQGNGVAGGIIAPTYTAASIVNAASNQPALAPNTIASLYGENLSYYTHQMTSGDFRDGGLPTNMDGVTVYVAGLASVLFYVSPTQINFLVPSILLPGPATVYVAREGVGGPPAVIQIEAEAPGLFQWGPTTAVATHIDGSPLTVGDPAVPSEVIVLYCTGLGSTTPLDLPGEIPIWAKEIDNLADLSVALNGTPVDPSQILYAGVTPGNAGLYQINLKLPPQLDPDPQVVISFGNITSPQGVKITAQ